MGTKIMSLPTVITQKWS